MPVHDWTRVDAGIFHDFHHAWIEELKRALNAGILPPEYYALAEQHAAGFGPDVLALQASGEDDTWTQPATADGGLLLAPPPLPATAETDLEFYRRKQNVVAVRHVTGDRIIAMIEVVSQGNKSSAHALRSFLQKTSELLSQGIHLLILDLYPPGPRDPSGIHGAIWSDLTPDIYTLLDDKPLTLAAYESAIGIRAFVRHVAVGDLLPDMSLFLRPNRQVPVPLERTYEAAYAVLPKRWQRVLEQSVEK
jgi:uncharacterized protein DUF4058